MSFHLERGDLLESFASLIIGMADFTIIAHGSGDMNWDIGMSLAC